MTNRRRLVIALGASALAAPLASFEQQSGKTYRIGYLGTGWQTARTTQIAALRQGLQALRYVEGKNLVLEQRWAEGKYNRLPELAAELGNLKMDVLLTTGTPCVCSASIR